MKTVALFLVIIAFQGVLAVIRVPVVQRGEGIGPSWAPTPQHILHSGDVPNRAIDIKVKFGQAFEVPAKVILGSTLLDYQDGVPQGYLQELRDLTLEGFTVRLYALTNRQFYTNMISFFATDDPRFHVQYFDTTDVGDLNAATDAARSKIYELPIVGWTPSDVPKVATFLQGVLASNGDVRFQSTILEVTPTKLTLRVELDGTHRLSRFRVGFALTSQNSYHTAVLKSTLQAGQALAENSFDFPVEYRTKDRFVFFGISRVWTAARINGRVIVDNFQYQPTGVSCNFKTWAGSVVNTIAIDVVVKLVDKFRYSTDCVVLFSECNFAGNAIEVCEKNNNLQEAGIQQVKSVYVPAGYTIKLYDQTNLAGKTVVYKSSQVCLENIVFSFLQMNEKQE